MNPSSPPLTPTASFPAPRVAPNALHAFGGVARLTLPRFFSVGHGLAVAGLLVVLGLIAIGASTTSVGLARYSGWAAGFYVCFLVPILAFISAAGAMRDDLGAGSADYVFTRPLWRPAFVGFRYLAHVVCTQLEFVLGLAVILGVGVYRDVPGLWEAVPRLLLTQVVVVVAFSAFGLMCGLLTSRYVIVGLLYGAIVEAGIGSVPTQLSHISMVRHALGMVQPLLGGERIGMGGPLAASPLSVPAAVALLVAVAVAMLAVAAVVFARREFAGAASREP